MVERERRRRITERELRTFEAAIQTLVEQGIEQETGEALARRILVDAMRSQAADLRDELDEYRKLGDGEVTPATAAW